MAKNLANIDDMRQAVCQYHHTHKKSDLGILVRIVRDGMKNMDHWSHVVDEFDKNPKSVKPEDAPTFLAKDGYDPASRKIFVFNEWAALINKKRAPVTRDNPPKPTDYRLLHKNPLDLVI